jgi:hypothetical protein
VLRFAEPLPVSIGRVSGPSPPFSSRQQASQQVFLHSCQVTNSITDDGLTELSQLNLFGRQRERGEQLYEYSDNHLIHGISRRDLGIDLEAVEEVPNRLEQIGQGTVVICDALDRLIRLNVTNMHAQRLNIDTYGE